MSRECLTDKQHKYVTIYCDYFCKEGSTNENERMCERVDSLRLKDLLTSDNSIRSGFHLSYLGRELVVADNARKCGISTVHPVRNY